MDFDGQPIAHLVQQVTWDPIIAKKGGFKHKEIYEQPRAVRDTWLGRVSQQLGKMLLQEMEIETLSSEPEEDQ